ncbi:MAG: domain S-box protein [Mucilaginibacter sp.]|jgi:PAS domain S-box-containing protein|nr:domain S-box protein [Mucilaginibacter sp.]
MTSDLRRSGIDIIGDISWGTHFCHFYDTEKDLLSILVPFFKAGLESNEYCIWVTSAQITVDEAYLALQKAVPQLDKYLERGSIEIVTHTDWYLKNGKIDLGKSIPSILDRLRAALQQNFEGVRANGDESWLDRKEWKNFIEYEKELNPLIAQKQLIIMCTYPLDKCEAATDILDIAFVHESAVAKRKGKWEVLEAPELKKSKAHIQQENKLLEKNVAERTEELAKVNKKLDKSQSRLRAIFNTTDIAFLLLDSDFKVLTYNSIANRWSELSFGVKLEEGANFVELLKEDRKEPVGGMMKSTLAGNSFNYEISYPLKDESSIWYRISMHPVKDLKNHIIGICCSATDITAGKLAEMERMRISNDLVQRNKDLEQFAYIISHNLRAPLANIIGLSKILKQEDISTDDKVESEEFLFQSITKLDEIVKDLNQILQIRRDVGEKKERIVFSELVNHVLTGFHLLVEQEHIKVITDFSQADGTFAIKSYLYSIFYNLISNSIKYRQPEIPLVIELKSWKQGDKIMITFKDNARGIDLSTHGEEVFGLYKRFNTDTEGKGIGLYMVRNQVEALGGSIHVSSQANIGSIFSVELPT